MNIESAIAQLSAGKHLKREQAYAVFQQVMGGEATEGQIGALLALIQSKGLALDEIIGAAKVMREMSSKVHVDLPHLVDTCGTGGSGENKLFNVSTAAAFVAASAGANVAKHGNRRATGKSGSADVLELAGAALDLKPVEVAICVEKLGVGFMFAPAHHSAMRHVMPVRRAIGIPTIFNMLGPVTNPAGAPNQVIGVGNPMWLWPLAETLQELGSRHVLLVHSRGLDEIALDGETQVVELREGRITERTCSPEEFGVERRDTGGLSASDVASSLALLRTSLKDVGSAAADLVRINAAAALHVAGIGQDLREASSITFEAMSSGAALDRFESFVALTRKLRGARGS